MKARSPSDPSTSADSADRASGGGRPRVAARRTAGVLLLCAAAGVLLVSCGDDRPPPTPEPAGTAGPSRIIETPEPTSATSTTSTTEAADPPPPDAGSADAAEQDSPAPADDSWPTSADAGLDFEVDGDTRWQEVFDALTAAERSCIREALGDEMMEWFPETSVLASGDGVGVWLLLPCVEPRLVEFLILETLRVGVEEMGFTPGADELSCLREWVAGLDRDAIAEAVSGGDPEVLARLSTDMTACVPDLILEMMFLGFGVELDELGDDEQACLRDWVAGFDWAALDDSGTDDSSGAGGVMSGLVNCVPDLYLDLMLAEAGMELDELNDDERACLRDSVSGIDWTGLNDAFETELGVFATLTAGMMNCVPDVFLAGVLGTGVQLDELSPDEQACLREWVAGIDATELEDSLFDDNLGLAGEGPAQCLLDDHADSPAGASAVDVGEPVEGTLEYVEDVDYFVFEAEEGVSYEIDVTLGTLSDSLLTLYGADEWELAHNDDVADSLASRLHWTAPESGDYYVEVAGFDSGSYALTVTASEGGGATYSLDA